MKKFMSMLLACAMILSVATILAVPTSAIVEGDWVTSRAADDYQDPESYRPACGYRYEIDKGLLTVSADYTNNTPYTHIHTKKTYNLTEANADGNGNSVSVQFTVLDFAYGGEYDNKDHWVSFSLHSKEIFAPGQTGYGEGVSVLVRGSGNGSAIAQFFSLDDEGGYKLFSQFQVSIPFDQDNHEVYDFSVKYKDGKYAFYLCGQEFTDATGYADQVLNEYCADGAYVGMSFYTGETGTPIEICVNKFQGEIPYGEDSAEPEDNLNNFAPIADSSTVEAGKPALIWNANKEQFNKFNGSNLDFAVNDDGTVKLNAKSGSGYFIFSPRSSISYQAADFPVIAALVRNCYAEYGTIYYSAGDVMGAQPDCSCDVDLAEYDYGEGWYMGILDLTGDLDWKGRVNMIRCDFVGIDIEDEEMRSFDVAYLAAFRTIEDAEQYVNDYLIALLGALPETDEKETQDNETIDSQTQLPESNSEVQSFEENTEAEQSENSCGSVVAAPVIIFLTMLSVTLIVKKKD